MKEITKYKAVDGREFESKEECREYEGEVGRSVQPTKAYKPDFMSPMDMMRDPETAKEYRKNRNRF